MRALPAYLLNPIILALLTAWGLSSALSAAVYHGRPAYWHNPDWNFWFVEVIPLLLTVLLMCLVGESADAIAEENNKSYLAKLYRLADSLMSHKTAQVALLIVALLFNPLWQFCGVPPFHSQWHTVAEIVAIASVAAFAVYEIAKLFIHLALSWADS